MLGHLEYSSGLDMVRYGTHIGGIYSNDSDRLTLSERVELFSNGELMF